MALADGLGGVEESFALNRRHGVGGGVGKEKREERRVERGKGGRMGGSRLNSQECEKKCQIFKGRAKPPREIRSIR